ncbi:MAG: DUF6527 family protein [Solirubrobacterales bacterium]
MGERQKKYRHEFVEVVPENLIEGVLYVSLKYKSVSHLCMCGCGEKVVFRLAPQRFKIKFDGESVSLSPSVGNSNFACRSHYWLEHGEVEWLPPLSDRQIERARGNAHRVTTEPHRRSAGFEDEHAADESEFATESPSIWDHVRGVFGR